MLRVLFLIGLGLAGPSQAQDAAWEARRSQCVGFMVAGAYPSGLVEQGCTRDFGLPSAFLFKCVRAQQLGFESRRQRAACSDFFVRSARQARDGHVLN